MYPVYEKSGIRTVQIPSSHKPGALGDDVMRGIRAIMQRANTFLDTHDVNSTGGGGSGAEAEGGSGRGHERPRLHERRRGSGKGGGRGTGEAAARTAAWTRRQAGKGNAPPARWPAIMRCMEAQPLRLMRPILTISSTE